jgi:uncharacterized protein YceK
VRNWCTQAALLLSLAVTGAAMSGCLAVAGAAAGVGTYAYLQGEMNTTVEAPLDQVWAAALAAADDLEFSMVEQTKDALQGRLRVNQADGTPVRISVDRQTDTLTEVRVRVGLFGDERTPTPCGGACARGVPSAGRVRGAGAVCIRGRRRCTRGQFGVRLRRA